MAIVTRTHASAIICLLAFSAVQPGFCDEDFIHDAAEFGGPSGGVVRSDQMLELGVTTSNGLRLEGEQCLRLGNVDRAVQLLQRALEMSPADMDGRILYATALEKKLTKQKKKDPKLFNFCVKQWYYVAKNSQFEDQKSHGLKHLDKLTGKLPKWRERPAKYLARVLIPEDGSVKVAFSSGSKEGKERERKEKMAEEALR